MSFKKRLKRTGISNLLFKIPGEQFGNYITASNEVNEKPKPAALQVLGNI
jgi:hypothetical protein